MLNAEHRAEGNGSSMELVVVLDLLAGGKSGRLLGVGPLDNERGANEW